MIKLDDLELIKDKDIRLEEYVETREYVKKKMTNPEWLGDFSIEDIQSMLNDNTELWLFRDNIKNQIVCSMMGIPSTEKALSKFELLLPVKEVIDYGPMFVCCDYIGNKLQFQMLRYMDEYYKKKGYKFAISTIHPENVYSISNFEKDEFILKSTKEFKRGVRNIYLKKL